MPPLRTAEHFFKNFTKTRTGCWKWTGPLTSDKKPSGNYEGIRESATRISWRIHNDPHLDDDVRIWQKCKNDLCVNPKHLRAKKPARVMAPEWVAMSRNGWTHAKIAKQDGVARGTVTRAIINWGIENNEEVVNPFLTQQRVEKAHASTRQRATKR